MQNLRQKRISRSEDLSPVNFVRRECWIVELADKSELVRESVSLQASEMRIREEEKTTRERLLCVAYYFHCQTQQVVYPEKNNISLHFNIEYQIMLSLHIINLIHRFLIVQENLILVRAYGTKPWKNQIFVYILPVVQYLGV